MQVRYQLRHRPVRPTSGQRIELTPASARGRNRGTLDERMPRRSAVRGEGHHTGRWILLDFGDLVVHVFHEQERMYYGLERLWKDCPVVPIELPAASAAE